LLNHGGISSLDCDVQPPVGRLWRYFFQYSYVSDRMNCAPSDAPPPLAPLTIPCSILPSAASIEASPRAASSFALKVVASAMALWSVACSAALTARPSVLAVSWNRACIRVAVVFACSNCS